MIPEINILYIELRRLRRIDNSVCTYAVAHSEGGALVGWRGRWGEGEGGVLIFFLLLS